MYCAVGGEGSYNGLSSTRPLLEPREREVCWISVCQGKEMVS